MIKQRNGEETDLYRRIPNNLTRLITHPFPRDGYSIPSFPAPEWTLVNNFLPKRTV